MRKDTRKRDPFRRGVALGQKKGPGFIGGGGGGTEFGGGGKRGKNRKRIRGNRIWSKRP